MIWIVSLKFVSTRRGVRLKMMSHILICMLIEVWTVEKLKCLHPVNIHGGSLST